MDAVTLDMAKKYTDAQVIEAGGHTHDNKDTLDLLTDDTKDLLFNGVGIATSINVKAYGAKGDGVTDDTAAIQAAIDAIETAGGGTLHFPLGTYVVNTAVSKALTHDLSITMAPGAKIDGTASTETTLISLGGSRLTNTALSGNPAKYDITIEADSTWAATLSEGDFILITSTDLWNSARAYYYKGEMAEILSVSGTTITLKKPLNDSYTGTTTTLHKLSMPQVKIDGLNIERNSNHVGVEVAYSKDVAIKNVNCTGTRYAGIIVSYVYGGMVENCQAKDCYYTGSGVSYGIQIYSSMYLTVLGGRYSGRHGITMGGQEPFRYIVVNGATVDSHIPANQAALDTHGNGEHIQILNCYLSGTIGMTAINITISNNIVAVQGARTGITVAPEINSDYYRITNNIIHGSSGTYGISVYPAVSDLTIDTLDISGNTTRVGAISLSIMPVVTGLIINNFILNYNDMRNTSSAGYVVRIYKGTGGEVPTIKRLTAISNRFTADAYRAFYLDTVGTVGEHYFQGCEFSSAHASNYGVYINSAYNVTFDKCRFIGTSTPYPVYNYFVTLNKLELLDCIFDGFGSDSGVRCESGVQAVKLINPVFSNVTGTPNFNTRIHVTENRLFASNVDVYRTAAPSTSGTTWLTGDRCWNSDPAPEEYLGWICTTAGTMGTLSITGSIESGSATLTVSAATNLRVGQYITIAGVTGIKRITNISDTTVTIDSNSDATVSNAAVAWSAAVWKGFGVIQS